MTKEPLWLKVLTLFVAALLLFVIVSVVQAAPLYEAAIGPVRVVLHDDQCALDAVANLPGRAQWIEGARTHEGCWAATAGIVILLFGPHDCPVSDADIRQGSDHMMTCPTPRTVSRAQSGLSSRA